MWWTRESKVVCFVITESETTEDYFQIYLKDKVYSQSCTTVGSANLW